MPMKESKQANYLWLKLIAICYIFNIIIALPYDIYYKTFHIYVHIHVYYITFMRVTCFSKELRH